jgi:hypothetical protein
MSLSAIFPGESAEIIHGIGVADPDRWPENRSSAEACAWIKEQQFRHDGSSILVDHHAEPGHSPALPRRFELRRWRDGSCSFARN